MKTVFEDPLSGELRAMRNRWSTAVGRVLLAFGEIEWATYKGLQVLPKDRIFEASFSLPFGKRVDLLLSILDGWPPTIKHLDETKDALREAKALSKERDFLAHNPQRMSFYLDETGEIGTIAEEIGHYTKTDTVLTFGDVSSLAERAEMLEKRLLLSLKALIDAESGGVLPAT